MQQNTNSQFSLDVLIRILLESHYIKIKKCIDILLILNNNLSISVFPYKKK